MKNQQRVADSNFDRFQARQGLAAKNQSQMTKLLPQLQIGAKKGPDSSQVLAKVEARTTGLKALKKELGAAVLKVSKLYLVDQDQRLRKLTSALKAVENIRNQKQPTGVQAHLRRCQNELVSLREGVYTNAATSKKALSLLACLQAVEEIDRLIEASVARETKVKTEAAGPEEMSVEDIQKVLEQTKKESSQVQSLKDREFVIERLPVIPIVQGQVNLTKLKAMGVKISSIDGYTVIHNQLVIGVNKSAVETRKGSEHRSMDPKKQLEAAQKILRSVEKQTKQKLQFVDERPYGAVGGAWYWVMPERELNILAQSLPGKVVKLQRWGFAA